MCTASMGKYNPNTKQNFSNVPLRPPFVDVKYLDHDVQVCTRAMTFLTEVTVLSKRAAADKPDYKIV